MNGEYQIFLRNRETGKRGDLFERYTSMDLTLNWGDLSKFTLKGKTTSGIEFEVGDGLVFYRNNEEMLCAEIEDISIDCKNVSANLIEWSASGKEDSVVFSRRLVFPDPTDITFLDSIVDKTGVKDEDTGEYGDDAYADNRQIYYIKRNMGSEALSSNPDRRIEGLTFPDDLSLGHGTQAESAYRYKALDEVIKEIGKETDDEGNENNIYPKYYRNPMTGTKSIVIPRQRDMTGTVLLSPDFGNISAWSKSMKIPKCNAVWVCSGSYDGDELDDDGKPKQVRRWIYMEDEDSIARFGRIEKIVTKSDLKVVKDDEETDEDETVTEEEVDELLEKEGKQYLEENAYKEKFTATMVETPSLQFMVDWKLGDLVTCMIDGQKFPSTIKTVEISYSNGLEKVKPTIGENEKGEFAELFDKLYGLDRRMDTEEQN